MPADCPKDSNMECTVVARILELVFEEFYRDKPHAFPRTLIVATDNTAREANNQVFATFLSWLQGSGVFDEASKEGLQVGHTHNEIDQRFSTVTTVLMAAPTLETPLEFADWIVDIVRPPQGRTIHVELLNSTFDWQQWLFRLNVHINGLTPTTLLPEFNHVWHFIRRDLMNRAWPDLTCIECEHTDFADREKDGGDSILVTRHFMHSTAASQQPLLVLPVEMRRALRKDDLKVNDP